MDERESQREREGVRQSLSKGRFQCDAAGCELLSSNWSPAFPLTEPESGSESGNCTLPALKGSSAAQFKLEAD